MIRAAPRAVVVTGFLAGLFRGLLAGLLWGLPAGLLSVPAPAMAAELPDGFVRLRDLAPDVVEDLRYAGADNFTGRPVPGYRRGRCILARPAAEALARVQRRAAASGLTLRVFDCYRPKRAVAAFMAWAADPAAADDRSAFHPRIARGRVVVEGYVARVSSHSRGVAVDLTLQAAPAEPVGGGATGPAARPCDPPAPPLLDTGTGFDCFDARAASASRLVGEEARRNRRRLAELMAAEGFSGYAGEWWHFTFRTEGFRLPRDFPVE